MITAPMVLAFPMPQPPCSLKKEETPSFFIGRVIEYSNAPSQTLHHSTQVTYNPLYIFFSPCYITHQYFVG